MADHAASQSLPSSPAQDDTDTSPSKEQYARLDDLLHQILALAAEIASKKRDRSRPAHKSGADSSDQEDDHSSSSLQEPFSPGSLALSLDAIVEGKGSSGVGDPGMCCLGRAHSVPSSGAAVPEPPPPTRLSASQVPASPILPAPAAVDTLQIPCTPRGMDSGRASLPGANAAGDDGMLMIQSPSPRWHVRISPVSPISQDLIFPSPSSPSLVKLEAVMPYHPSTFGDCPAATWISEDSSFVIRRPMVSTNAGVTKFIDGQSPLGHLMREDDQTLKDFIDDWEYAAEAPEADEIKESNDG